MKSLQDIWQAHLDDETTDQDLKALTWHLENDEDPQEAISITADMGLKKLAPVMAKHLDNRDDFIRQLTIGCLLGQLELSEYTEKGFEMAQHDEDEVRNIAIFRLGKGLNNIPFKISQKIAQYLLEVFQHDTSKVTRNSAYFSILDAMNIPRAQKPLLWTNGAINNFEVDSNIVSEFCKKYKVTMQQA